MADDDFKFLEQNKFIPSDDEIKNISKKSQKDLPQSLENDSKEVSGESKALSGAFFPTPPPTVDITPSNSPEKAPQDDLATDYQYVRTNLYAITERSVEALTNLAQIADQSQHPRAYEVVALLVNTIASAQKDLMTIHQQKAKIEGIVAKNQPDVINNNLFVGNTAQLDEIIKKMTKPKDDSE